VNDSFKLQPPIPWDRHNWNTREKNSNPPQGKNRSSVLDEPKGDQKKKERVTLAREVAAASPRKGNPTSKGGLFAPGNVPAGKKAVPRGALGKKKGNESRSH